VWYQAPCHATSHTQKAQQQLVKPLSFAPTAKETKPQRQLESTAQCLSRRSPCTTTQRIANPTPAALPLKLTITVTSCQALTRSSSTKNLSQPSTQTLGIQVGVPYSTQESAPSACATTPATTQPKPQP
jgi:hypothetical protein